MSEDKKSKLLPFALKDAPALIETVFPAQKVSFEAQRERKAGAGQTLTALGSYWKGRKPLILVRAIVLGCLLPTTDDAEKDLEIYEALMGFDLEGQGRRAVPKSPFSPNEIARTVALDNPWESFSFRSTGDDGQDERIASLSFPFDPDAEGTRISWRRDASDEKKAYCYGEMLALTKTTYEDRAVLCSRPEELDQNFLLGPVWGKVNAHYAHLGLNAHSMPELMEQLGILRYGHRPKVGDTFAGGGSIPFEAARMGCDAYASDLNPIACMLNWGNFNIIGASPERRAEIEKVQQEVAAAVDAEITRHGIEHNSKGDRAKAYLYCLETRCPDTGYMVPLAPNWIISKTHNVVAQLVPDSAKKRFDITVKIGVSKAEMENASGGTVQNGNMVYQLNGRTYSTPISTIRGDFRAEDGTRKNRLRMWDLHDFKPRPNDIFQERLYCIQWITADTIGKSRQTTYFAAVTEKDLQREQKVEEIVGGNLLDWQRQGLVPDMEIEPGYNTDQPIRERGWRYWHQLFNARQLYLFALLHAKHLEHRHDSFITDMASALNRSSRLSRWDSADRGREGVKDVFANQALNTLFNFGARAFFSLKEFAFLTPKVCDLLSDKFVGNHAADHISVMTDLFITDPPYADAVHYHEITEFFIAWLRKNPPPPFNEWTWDSRRALAIKGDGDDFRRGMVDAYKAMAKHMPDNGMQCVMFTHQNTDVWSDMVNIFWAAGLQVVASWYIATETTSELKKGGYVQGTVILMLRKRPAGDNPGFTQRILPKVRAEVQKQVEQMMHLNEDVKERMGEPVFNDADLQMAGYAAALKVLTGYTQIGGIDVTTFAMRPKVRGEVTVVDEIVQQASEAANNLLVPEGLPVETWQVLNGIQRFFLRMLDMETTGASKLDNYQNFAKAFRVEDYSKVMASMTANNACLKQPEQFNARDLSSTTEIGPTWLGALIVGIQQLLKEIEPKVVLAQLMEELPDFLDNREKLIDLANFLSQKCSSGKVRDAAEILSARLRNQRAFGQS